MNKTALNSQKEKHSMLSLRRATGRHTSQKDPQFISIHALLAESDENNDSDPYRGCNFYPRSPCGERRFCVYLFKFQPLISIHALLAESDFAMVIEVETSDGFLSTLSLRRATVCLSLLRWHSLNFYPRSPCGERLTLMHAAQAGNAISIHALLAESDTDGSTTINLFEQFLSTLSLRRATLQKFMPPTNLLLFLSTLSLRRATARCLYPMP